MHVRQLNPLLILGLALTFALLVAGCGGGATNGPTTQVAGSRKSGLARFDVDLTTRKVKISSGDAMGRAILTGGAVTFSSSDVLNVGGDSGKRELILTVQDGSGEVITAGRMVIGNLSNTPNASIKQSALASTTAGNGTIGHADGIGSAATFQNPVSVAAGAGPSAGSYFVSDSGNYTIRQMWPDGTVTTFAGLAQNPGSADGTGSAARFNNPGQVAVDMFGNVFVADTGNDTIRRITPLGAVSTIGGIVGKAGHVDGTGDVATFTSPVGIAVESDVLGSTAIQVSEPNDIRELFFEGGPRALATSYVSALIAGSSNAGYTDGAAAGARFNNPQQIVWAPLQRSLRLFIADAGNHAVRATDINGNGTVTTIAGANGIGSTDGPGSVARFDAPCGVAVSPSNTDQEFACFVTDRNTGLIRLITHVPGAEDHNRANYQVDTLTSGAGFADGDGTVAKFSGPFGIAATQVLGHSGTLEIADTANQRIRKLNISSAGLMSGGTASAIAEPVRLQNWDDQMPNQTGPTVAWGKRFAPLQGGAASVDLQFYVPQGVSAFTFTGYVEADTSLVNLPAAGSAFMTTLAGNGLSGDSDGPGRLAQFNNPDGIAVGPHNPNAPLFRAVIADQSNHRIRILDTVGAVRTLSGSIPGFLNGPANTAQFNGPRGVAITPDGNIVIADAGNRRIRRITFSSGGAIVTTIAGNGTNAVTDGVGNVAAFMDPTGIAVDPSGSIYVTEAASDVVRKISYVSGDPSLPSSYLVATIAGSANAAGSTDGTGTAARFSGPRGVYANSRGTVYVADTNNHTVRALARGALNGYTVTTVAGVAGSVGSADGISTARFSQPSGISGDGAHNLYVCELGNHRIRRISPLAQVVTIAGSIAGYVDGAAGKMNRPASLVVEPFGSILVTDQGNDAVRSLQRLITDGQSSAP